MKKALAKKRWLSGVGLTLAAGVLATAVSGCSSSTATSSTAATTSATKPTQITAIMDTDETPQPKDGQQQFLDEFKKETGITLKLNQPSHNEYTEKLNLVMVSGDVPDVVEITGNNYVKYATNGALYDVTSLIKNSSVYKNCDQATINQLKVKNKLYAVPWEKGTGTVTLIRQDWLDKYNLKAPTTYDEFINVLKTFVKNDPAGKGGTIGLTAAGLLYGDSKNPSDPGMYLPEFYQGANADFELKNNKWVDGFSEQDTIEAFKRLQSAYSQGLIDKEIVTNKTTTCRDKWSAGNVGIFNYWAGTWVANLEDQLKATVPTAKVTVINPIKNASYEKRAPIGVSISKSCKNPASVFKYFMEFIHDGKTDGGTMLFAHGVKGVHYDVDSSGKYSARDSLSQKGAKYLKLQVDIGQNIEKDWKDPMPVDSRITNSTDIFKKYSKSEALFPSSPTYNQNITDLTTLRCKLLSDIVVNGKDVNTAISSYKSSTSSYMPKILKEFNEGGVKDTSSGGTASSSSK